MNTSNYRKAVVLAVALLATTLTGMAAAEEELCAPFMDGKVDESVLETMLNAAHEGHLYRMVAETSKVGFSARS